MAYIGMRYPVAAVMQSSMVSPTITYATPGFVVGTAVSANLTFETGDNPDYGDDVVIDNDRGINGYSISIEANDLTASVREKLLGWKAITGTGSEVTHYEVTDENAPVVGFGFVRIKMRRGVKSYEAFWFHKVQFVSGGENAATKERQISWQHQTLDGTGIGHLDSSGAAKYFDWQEFTTLTAAQAWLNTRAGIS